MNQLDSRMPERSAGKAQSKISSRWAIGVSLAYSLIMIAFGLYLIPDLISSLDLRPIDWAGIVRNPMPILMGLAGLVGAILIWRGRKIAGAWTVVISLIVGAMISNFLAQGYGLVLGILLLLVASVLADQLLSQRQRLWMMGVSGIFAVALILVDLYDPLVRSLQETEEAAVATVLLVLFGLLFLAYIVIRFRDYRLATKLALSFLLVALVIGGTIALFTINALSASLTQSVGDGIYSLAVTQGRAVGDALTREVDGLSVLALSDAIVNQVATANKAYEGRSEAEIQASINQLDQQWTDLVKAGRTYDALIQATMQTPAAAELAGYRGLFPENVEVFITDIHGAQISTSEPTSDYNQADEGWWQAAYKKGVGATYISTPEYDQSSQTLSILIAVPIRNKATGELIGVLRTTVNLGYIQQLLALAKLGTTGKVDLHFPNPDSASGVSGLTKGKYTDISADEIAQLKTMGSAGYANLSIDATPSLVSQSPVTPAAGYANIAQLGWQVVVHQDLDEALASVEAQRRTTLLLVLATMALAALGGLALARFLAGPITRLRSTAMQVESGHLEARARVETADEVGELAVAFNDMTARVGALVGTLEQRVSERTQALQASFEVSRRLSTILDQKELLTAVVDEVVRVYGYYHAQIYLFDEQRQNLVLAGGTGEAGMIMLARKHSLPRGRGLVGRAAELNQPVLVADTAADPGWLPNPLLPETRSEAAVPISISDQVLGVLDIQHYEVGGLGEAEVQLLLSLANQVAVAVQNARLYTQAQRQAEREAQVNVISQRIQAASSVEEVLKTALRELGAVLSVRGGAAEENSELPSGLSKASIYLGGVAENGSGMNRTRAGGLGGSAVNRGGGSGSASAA